MILLEIIFSAKIKTTQNILILSLSIQLLVPLHLGMLIDKFSFNFL